MAQDFVENTRLAVERQVERSPHVLDRLPQIGVNTQWGEPVIIDERQIKDSKLDYNPKPGSIVALTDWRQINYHHKYGDDVGKRLHRDEAERVLFMVVEPKKDELDLLSATEIENYRVGKPVALIPITENFDWAYRDHDEAVQQGDPSGAVFYLVRGKDGKPNLYGKDLRDPNDPIENGTAGYIRWLDTSNKIDSRIEVVPVDEMTVGEREKYIPTENTIAEITEIAENAAREADKNVDWKFQELLQTLNDSHSKIILKGLFFLSVATLIGQVVDNQVGVGLTYGLTALGVTATTLSGLAAKIISGKERKIESATAAKKVVKEMSRSDREIVANNMLSVVEKKLGVDGLSTKYLSI